jgi:hypothetical protein
LVPRFCDTPLERSRYAEDSVAMVEYILLGVHSLHKIDQIIYPR